MLEGQYWGAGEGGWGYRSDVIDMTGCGFWLACSQDRGYCRFKKLTFAMLRVSKANDSSNVAAPIASLGH